MSKLSKEQYLHCQLSIIQIGRQVMALPLAEFIEQISKAEAVAPILDPSLYKRAMGNLTEIKGLAEKLLEVDNAYQKVFISVMKTELDEAANEPDKAT